jgi:hypothetical protein
MKANAQRSFGRSAMLVLTVVSLSGCVTANTLENARTWTEYRNPKSRFRPPDPKAHVGKVAQLSRLETEGVIRLADYKDNAALEAQLVRLEEEGVIQRIEYKGNPANYALLPLTVVADIALVPVYLYIGATHMGNVH